MRPSQPTALDLRASYHPLLAAGLALAAAVVSVIVMGTANVHLYLIVGLMFLACFGPAWVDYSRRRIDYFETIHIFGLIYFLSFGMGAIWTVHKPSISYDIHVVPYVPQAALYCLIGYLFLLIGYYAPWPRRRRSAGGMESLPTSVLFVALPAILGFCGYFGALIQQRLFLSGARLTPLVSLLSNFAILLWFAWALAWLAHFSGRSSTGQKVFLFGALIPMCLIVARATTGEKASLIIFLGIPLIAYWYVHRRLPRTRLLVLGLLVIFLIFPLYNTFRRVDKSASTGARLSMTVDTIRHWDSQTYRQSSIELFQKRMAYVNSVAVVIRDTGRWVPFEYGRTLILGPISLLIPRILWPDKPTITLGRDFGQTFRVFSAIDRETSIGVSVPGELYWNFGLPGIMFGMLPLGFAMRWLYYRFGPEDRADPLRLATHIVLLIMVLKLSGGLGGGSAGIVKFLVIVSISNWLSRRVGLLTAPRTPALSR